MHDNDDEIEMLRSAMAELAANLASPTDITAILESVTALAVDLIGDVDIADVLLVDGDEHETVAATDPLAVNLDKLQLTLQEGPCLSALASMMAFRLYTSTRKTPHGAGGRGALNLFSRSRREFSIEDQALGAMLATHAATALMAVDRQQQFESALASRDLIAQAKGIVMERFKVDAVHAFHMMTKLSQDSNTPVRVLAQQIVDST